MDGVVVVERQPKDVRSHGRDRARNTNQQIDGRQRLGRLSQNTGKERPTGFDLPRSRRIRREEPLGQSHRPDVERHRPGHGFFATDDQFGRAATDVEDEGISRSRTEPASGPQEGRAGFLRPGQDFGSHAEQVMDSRGELLGVLRIAGGRGCAESDPVDVQTVDEVGEPEPG